MSVKLLWLACSLAFIYWVNANLAPFITKCKGTDSKCITESTQTAIPIFAKGIPDVGVERMDPMILKTVDASKPNLKLLLDDIKIVGLKNCEAQSMKRDVEKGKLFPEIQCTVNLEAHYNMKGQLIPGLPPLVEGIGKLHITIMKVLVIAEVDLVEKDGKDGEKHWSIQAWKYSFELKDKSDVKFDNLFNGNLLLGQRVNKLISENSNEVLIRIVPEIITAAVGNVVENVNNFFTAAPIKDLSLD